MSDITSDSLPHPPPPPSPSPSISVRLNPTVLRDSTHNVVRWVIVAQICFFTLLFLLNLPYLITYITSGRFQQGWRLQKNDQTSEISLEGKPLGHVSKNNLRKRSRLYLRYTYWYNLISHKNIWGCTRLTVGKLIIMQLYFAMIMIALSWRNIRLQVFMKNFRRPGHVAIAQVPLLFMLSMKNSIFGLLGISYERLNFLHRLVGRLILLCSLIHAGLIISVQVNPISKLLTQARFMYGAIALGTMLLMTLTSWGPIRRRLYQCFLMVHVLGYFTLLAALWNHVQATHIPIYISGGCLLLDRLLRLLNTRWRSAHFTSLPGSVTMVEVTRTGTGWRAGQHVFLRVFAPKYMFESHPFTIANAPATDSPYGTNNTLILVSKAHGDYTRRIHQIGLTKAALEIEMTNSQSDSFGRPCSDLSRGEKSEESMVDLNYDSQLVVSVEGPYGPMLVDMRTHETVVLIASGIAFTFIMSLFEEIVGSSLRGTSITRVVYIVWTLRDSDMVEAFINPIQETLRVARAMGIAVVFRLHVTYSIGTYMPTPMPELCVIPTRADIQQIIFQAVHDTLAEIEAKGGSECGQGVGIAVSTGSLSLSKAVQDAALAIDGDTFEKVGGLRMHVENFGNG